MRVGMLIVLSALACESARAPVPPQLADAGAATQLLRADDAKVVATRFLAALDSADRAALGDTLSMRSLCDALQKATQNCVGPERLHQFRDALISEITRDDWKRQYAGAAITGTELIPAAQAATVTVRLAAGVDRRVEVRVDDGKPRIARIY